MSSGSLSRRRLLQSSAAFVPALAILAMGRKARAFSMESLAPASGPASGLRQSLRCLRLGHAAIRSALQAQLAGETGAPGQTLTATETCPICGCPIVVTRVVD